MKYKIVLVMMLGLFVFLTAASPYPARFTVINQTDEDIYIVLYDAKNGNPDYPQLRMTKDGTVEDAERPTTVFTIERKVYDAQVFACGEVAMGEIDLTRNLQLNFVACEEWWQTSHPRFLGEPSQEKPNWFLTPGMADWRFVFPEIEKSK